MMVHGRWYCYREYKMRFDADCLRCKKWAQRVAKSEGLIKKL